MVVTSWLQKKFKRDFKKKSSISIQAYLNSLDLFPEYQKQIELLLFAEKEDDILNPKIIAAIIDGNRKILWIDRIREVIHATACV